MPKLERVYQKPLHQESWSFCTYTKKLFSDPRQLFSRIVQAILLPSTDTTTCPNSLQQNLEDTNLKYRVNIIENSKSGKTLRGVNVLHESQSSKEPSNQKWILLFFGNACYCDGFMPAAIELSDFAQCNVRMFDFRNSGMSDGDVTSLDQLIEDGKSHLAELLDEGIKDPLVAGLSLGGAIAPSVASSKEGTSLATFNTFSSLPNTVKAVLKQIPLVISKNYREWINSDYSNICCDWLKSLVNIPLSILDLLVRCINLVIEIFVDLIKLKAKDLKDHILELLITPIQDAIILISAIAGTILPFLANYTNKLVSYTLTKTPIDRATPVLVFTSPIVKLIIDSLLKYTGWSKDNTKAYTEFKGNKISFYAPKDDVIYYKDASLSASLIDQNTTIKLSESANHNTMAWSDESSKAKFAEFLRKSVNPELTIHKEKYKAIPPGVFA